MTEFNNDELSQIGTTSFFEECPWCDNPLDLEEIYKSGNLNNNGYFECPHCGNQYTINVEISYVYSSEMGPAIKDDEDDSQRNGAITPDEIEMAIRSLHNIKFTEED